MKNMKKGFTLIELLIVIAIIGILAGVILVSTSSARSKAQTAGAKQAMKSVIPYLIECDVNGTTVNSPYATTTAVCTGGPNYPTVSNATVGPAVDTTAKTITATVGGVAISCSYTTGACTP